MRKQQGFTLIELMIVIAILGILLAIAIPAYQDYAVRARASEGIMALAPAKLAVSEFRLSEGSFPTSRAAAGFSSVTTSYVTDITMVGASGAIEVNFEEGNLGAGTDIAVLLTPVFSGNAVVWDCTFSGAAADSQYVPSSCRN